MEANGRSAEQDYPLLIGVGTLTLAYGLRNARESVAA